MLVIDGTDYIQWKARARVLMFSPDQVRWLSRRSGIAIPDVGWREISAARLEPEETADSIGNVLCTVGLNRLTSLWIGAGGQAMNNAQMMLGVGDTATAGTAADTDMGAATGATHRYIQGSDAAFPAQANGQVAGQATFGAANGNFVWNEWAWGIATGALTPGTGSWSSIAASSAVIVNHKAPSGFSGTAKASPAVWALQTWVTISLWPG